MKLLNSISNQCTNRRADSSIFPKRRYVEGRAAKKRQQTATGEINRRALHPPAVLEKSVKTASQNFSKRKNLKRLRINLFKEAIKCHQQQWSSPNNNSRGGGTLEATTTSPYYSKKNKKRAGILGKASGVAVTLKEWWRDVGLCPRVAATPVGTLASNNLEQHPRRCSQKRRGSLRSMGQSFTMCKFNCRHKKSKFCVKRISTSCFRSVFYTPMRFTTINICNRGTCVRHYHRISTSW